MRSSPAAILIFSRSDFGERNFKLMISIKPMTGQHCAAVIEMMREFYSSPAVLTSGSEEIFRNDVEECISGSPYLEGYVFTEGDAVVGYAMAAKSFSTEFGKPCIWIEDIYLKPGYRGGGAGTAFFGFIEEKYPNVLFRLEVEEENERAVRVYRKNGFEVLAYMEMKK